MLTFQSCGKKGKSSSNKPLEVKDSIDGKEVIVDPLAQQQVICGTENCPKGLIKIFNFNSSSRYKSCLGAMIGGNRVITTATCLGEFNSKKSACENLYFKTMNQETPLKCVKILEVGKPVTNYSYLRRKDFAVIEIEEPLQKEAIILSSQKLENSHYPTWSIYNSNETMTVVNRKFCKLSEPNQSSLALNSELQLTHSFNINCYETSKMTEGSLIFNKYGQLIALYSQGLKYHRPNVISLGCIKSTTLPMLDGNNCPVYDRQQTDQSFAKKILEFKSKENLVKEQSFTSSLFKWNIYQYGNSKIYEPLCYLDFRTTKSHLRGFLNTKTNFYTSFNTYRMIIHIKDDHKSIEIEPVRLDAIIKSKKFAKTKMLKIEYTENIAEDQLQDYLNGKHVHRSSKVLKSCNELDK